MPRVLILVAQLIEEHLSRFVVDSDPRDTNRIWDQMFRASMFYGRKGMAIMVSALSNYQQPKLQLIYVPRPFRSSTSPSGTFWARSAKSPST